MDSPDPGAYAASRASLEARRTTLLGELAEVDRALGIAPDAARTPGQPLALEALMDALPAVALLDADGRVVMANQAWRALDPAIGTDGDGRAGGDAILAACDPVDGAEARALRRGIADVLAGRQGCFTLEYPCRTPDQERWFRVMAKPVRQGGGQGCVVMHLDVTERRLAEDSLRRNEARLRAILDAEPECVKVVSNDGRLLSMNAAGLRMIEAEAFQQVAGRPVRDLIHPEDWHDFTGLHQRVLDGGTGQLEFRIRGLQGALRWMDTHSTPLRDEHGHVEGVLSVTRDVSARREAEHQIAELRRLNQQILDSVGEGIQGIDLDGRISFANPAAQEMLGWREQEIVGQVAHALFHHHHPDGTPYERTDCPIYRTLHDGVPRRIDHECFFRRDGTAIPVEYVVTPVRDSAGVATGAVICFRDISARLANLAALARNEERFRLVARVTVNAIWDWDLATDVVTWNGGLESLFGYLEADVQAQDNFWSTRIHPEDRERVLADLHACLGDGRDCWELEYRFRRRDGSHAIVNDRGVVVRDADGAPTRMVGGMSDISGMRTLEAQLRASQRLEAVGQLTGGLAHDFNNLLTVVLGNAELLQERLPPGSADSELAGMILAAAERGSSLTQRLLAFARRQALETRTVRLGDLVREMEHLVRHAIGEHITLSLESHGADAWVVVDPAQMENALLNLCINARDAMPGGGTLTISVGTVRRVPPDMDPLCRPEPGDFVLLEVRDTGCGIPDEILPLTIEPFFTTKDTGKGTGLGLSMVYGLVKQSNGFLDIRSSRGRGTSVRIHLPRVADPKACAPGLAADDGALEGGSEHVLLVEDDPLVRRYVASQLAALGYRVSVAEGAPEALRHLAADGSIRLMLTDVMMPGMNGSELAEAARGLRPGLPVLFSSGYSEDTLASEGRLPEGVLLLAKPYHKAELARRVRQALA